FLAADPATAVRSKGLLTQQLVEGTWIRVAADPLAHIGALVASHATTPVAELPPFQGGAAGYVGYDWGMLLERVPRPRYDDLAVPDLLLALYDWVIAWDHVAQRAWVISTGIPERGKAQEHRAARRLAVVKDRLARLGAGELPARQKDTVAAGAPPRPARRSAAPRSEEHTSELQSRENLVCRLLPEKKNTEKPFLRVANADDHTATLPPPTPHALAL